MNTHLLLIDCPDEKGLVYRITGELLRHDFNIVSNQEFVKPSSNHFFMRTVFAGNGSVDDVIDELRKSLPAETNIRLAPTEKRSIVLMVTKEAHCLGDLRWSATMTHLLRLYRNSTFPFTTSATWDASANNMSRRSSAFLTSTSLIILFWQNICAC